MPKKPTKMPTIKLSSGKSQRKPKKILKITLIAIVSSVLLFLLAIFLLIKFTASNAEPFSVSDLTTAKDGAYSLKYNKSWTKATDPSFSVIYADHENVNRADSGIFISIGEDLSGSWNDIDTDQQQQLIETLSETLPKDTSASFDCKTPGKVSIDSDYAIEGFDKVIKFDIVCDELDPAKSNGDNSRMGLLVLIKGSRFHVVVGLAMPKSSYDQSEAAFEEIYRSIRLE